MSRCDGCGGEDCACCEVFIEQQMDALYSYEMMEDDMLPVYEEEDEEDEDC